MTSQAKRRWSESEDRVMCEQYGRTPNVALAAQLGRSVVSLHARAQTLRIARPRPLNGDHETRRLIRELSLAGHSDQEIADHFCLTRENVRYHRRQMGLPSNRLHPRQRARASELGRRMNADYPSTWGRDSREAAADFARESGWPVGLRMREIQILNLLAATGRPMTRLEICNGIGVYTITIDSRKSPRLGSDDGKGTYLAVLVTLGLVTRLAALGPRRAGKGRRVDLFCLGPAALDCLLARLGESRP